MELFFAIFIDILLIWSSVQCHGRGVEYQVFTSDVNNPSGGVKNFQHLFDSIQREDAKETKNYHSLLQKEVAHEQQVFNSMKGELYLARQNRASRLKNLYHKSSAFGKERVAFKRETNNEKEAIGSDSTTEILPKDHSIYAKLQAEADKYPANMAYQAGINAAKAVLIPEITNLKRDLEQSRNLNLEAIIPSLLRGDIEDLEKLYMPAIELTKEMMLDDLKKGDPTFKMPESMAKSYELSLHYLRWRYLLKNCLENYKDLKTMKDILTEARLTVDNIARYLALFFEKTSERIHGVMKKLSVSEVKKGLVENGVEDVNLINTALTLFAVRRGKKEELMLELIK